MPKTLLLLYFLVGCQSLVPDGFVKVPKTSPLLPRIAAWKTACFGGSAPGFAGFMHGENMPEGRIEAAWNQSFDTFTTQILSPLGASLAQVQLSPDGVNKYVHMDSLSVDGIAHFLQQVGAHGLRDLFCGTLFFGDEPKLYQPSTEGDELSSEVIFAQGTSSLAAGRVDWASSIVFSSENEEPDVTINAKARTSWTGTLADISWQGRLGKSPAPKIIGIHGKDVHFELTMDDFE